MKNKVIAACLLIVLSATITSCFSSRSKMGCPGNPTASTKFRG